MDTEEHHHHVRQCWICLEDESKIVKIRQQQHLHLPLTSSSPFSTRIEAPSRLNKDQVAPSHSNSDDKDDDAEPTEEDWDGVAVCGSGNHDGAWLSPCHCTGSMKWVHQRCLDEWIQRQQRGAGPQRVCRCTICGFAYKTRLRVVPPWRWTLPHLTPVEKENFYCNTQGLYTLATYPLRDLFRHRPSFLSLTFFSDPRPIGPNNTNNTNSSARHGGRRHGRNGGAVNSLKWLAQLARAILFAVCLCSLYIILKLPEVGWKMVKEARVTERYVIDHCDEN